MTAIDDFEFHRLSLQLENSRLRRCSSKQVFLKISQIS